MRLWAKYCHPIASLNKIPGANTKISFSSEVYNFMDRQPCIILQSSILSTCLNSCHPDLSLY